jgi:hypothetical protein
VDVVVGELGREEAVEELAHLVRRERWPALIAALQAKVRPIRSCWLRAASTSGEPCGELGDHLAEAALGSK